MTVNEEQFRRRAQDQGYSAFHTKDYGATGFVPGEMCELAANVMHTALAGPTGAKVILAKRPPAV